MNVLAAIIVEADHFQILVGDRAKGPLVDTSALWASSGSVASIPDAPELIAVPIVRYGGTTRIEVEVLPIAPRGGMPGWQSLGRFRLNVPSGELLLWGPEMESLDAAPRTPVSAGAYVGEAYSYGTSEVTDEYAREGPDRYRIVLWPSE